MSRVEGGSFRVQGVGCRVSPSGFRVGRVGPKPKPREKVQLCLTRVEKRISIELMTSDHKLEASREGSK